MKKLRSTILNFAHVAILRRLPLLTACLFLFTISALAQGVRITGRVTNEAGEALSGVSIQVKGATGGTSTDASGNYALAVPNTNSTLVFSYVGYNTREERVGDRTTINLSLSPSTTTSLSEVVVIGYGTATKRDLTGSVAKIQGEEIAQQPNTNPLASLQGRVAGLQVTNNAVPGETPDVRIRGTVSIGTTRPVYIVDGVFTDNMDFVNPNEIESIEVLKDPSSLAIFGIRGAGGAILVTTKRAKAGQVNINFSTSYGTKKLVDKIELANGDQFRQLLTLEANNQIADDPNAKSLYNFVNNVGTPGLSAYTGSTDWIDAVTRTAKFTQNNLSIDGSSEKNRFHMGLGYSYDEGLVKHIRYDRLNFNINDEYRVSKTWKLGFNLIASRENLPYHSGALENARRALPIISAETTPFTAPDPYTGDTTTLYLYEQTPIIQNSETNPLATLENSWDKKRDQRYRYVGNAFVDINITTDLNWRSTVYADLSNRNNREYTPLYNLWIPTNPAGDQIFAKNNLTAVRQEQNNTRAFQQDHILTYKKRFGDHSFTGTAGLNTYYRMFEQVTGTVSQSQPGVSIIPNDDRFWYLNTGYGDRQSIVRTATSQADYSTLSGLARVLYNFKNRYYVNASFRRDGSSQISQDYDNKFQNFWAVGAAWELTRENFMNNQEIFDYLKLKASTGLLGNFTAQGKDYPAYPTISTNSSAVFGNNLIPVFTSDYLYDPNLKWETVKGTEVGLETDLLDRRLHFEGVYYQKKTEDLIVLLNPPGVQPTLTNSGTIRNRGFELAANWNQQINKNFNYSIGGNLTTYDNEVLFLPFPVRPNIASSEQTPNQTETGFPIGYFYGLKAIGIYQSYTDILRSPVSTINGGGARPGDIKYADLNGDDIVDEKDRTMIGNPTPDFTYGINANMKYRAFDLSLDFVGSYGNEVYRVWGTSEQKNSVYNYPANYLEGWTGPGTSAVIPIVNQARLINRAPSTYGIEDGSFFRIRNVNLAYNITRIPRLNFVKSLRLSVGAQNLKTWKNNSGYSPEFAGDALSFGIDWGNASSAIPRVFTFGLNANF